MKDYGVSSQIEEVKPSSFVVKFGFFGLPESLDYISLSSQLNTETHENLHGFMMDTRTGKFS